MSKYVCIHGHFYQPPRENPWTERIERQVSAAPYHDWNFRIADECYTPNTQARILNGQGQEIERRNNYAWMSFNFGPTLLTWLEHHVPETYQKILEADRLSQTHFEGFGSAMAQAYNHMILPLAKSRDKYTQIYWGLRDFESRFRRSPAGMWLAETAVDTESLEIMADLGIKFVLLSPHQAKGPVDTRRPHVVRLKNSKSIFVFYYDGALSKAVAFDRLLNNGDHFADRLSQGFDPEQNFAQLSHIATDGESYGHHHRFGEMALAYALKKIQHSPDFRLCNYEMFLSRHSDQAVESEIVENTSWSCAHGVERWRSNCGCRIDTSQEPKQEWRSQLRAATDYLRDEVHKVSEIPAPAAIDWILNPHGKAPEFDLRKLELEKMTLFAQTSCAWFFDSVSGLEVQQNLAYAHRALDLYKTLFAKDLSPKFLELLGEQGARFFQEKVLPLKRNLAEILAQKYLLEAEACPWHLSPSFLLDQEERVFEGAKFVSGRFLRLETQETLRFELLLRRSAPLRSQVFFRELKDGEAPQSQNETSLEEAALFLRYPKVYSYEVLSSEQKRTLIEKHLADLYGDFSSWVSSEDPQNPIGNDVFLRAWQGLEFFVKAQKSC